MPDTTLSTPAGSASRRISPSFSVESGVNGDGFSTIVFPASSAGAIFQTPSNTGKFQGVIAPTTPSGPAAHLDADLRVVLEHFERDLERRRVLEPDRRADQLLDGARERLALLLGEDRRQLARCAP